jgi:hypothetical protein
VVGRRLAALTVGEHLNPFEHRVGELGRAVPDPVPVGEFGLYRCEVRFGDGIVECVSDAPHRYEQSGLAKTPAKRQGHELRRVVLVKHPGGRVSAAPVRDVERVDHDRAVDPALPGRLLGGVRSPQDIKQVGSERAGQEVVRERDSVGLRTPPARESAEPLKACSGQTGDTLPLDRQPKPKPHPSRSCAVTGVTP